LAIKKNDNLLYTRPILNEYSFFR